MATLLLTAVGTLVGGPIGGALGALAGQQLDMALIGSKSRQGPRLKELGVQTSSYGAPLGRYYGAMRVAGSVIWATELQEHRQKSGGGKGKPKVVSYSYSTSFAVSLSSRPIIGIGRIWADGNLLRGGAGDLKTTATLRVHNGFGDQHPDPLIAAAEGTERCPAFRNLAYAVFEDLALAAFGNRIPSLTFEVFADEGPVELAALLRDAVPETSVGPVPATVAGYAVETGTASDLIDELSAVAPLTCASQGGELVVRSAEQEFLGAHLLPSRLASSRGERRQGSAGFRRQHEPLGARRTMALRYYDTARDYQPGMQQGRGQSLPGEPATVDFPAALDASAARSFADDLAARDRALRETAAYRISEIDAALAPGQTVRIPNQPGRWLIESWELDSGGIELGLRRLPPRAAGAAAGADPGRANLPPDLLAAPTQLAAFELPWDGNGAGDTPAVFAAASSASGGWNGAALFVETAGSGLVAIGSSGRVRATLGTTVHRLGPASPHALDRLNTLEIDLAAADLALGSTSMSQLAMGANRALVGNEIVQFARAERVAGARWRIADLLRGRGGTEWAVPAHLSAERFVLIDETLAALDPSLIGDPTHTTIAALGLADPEPVTAPITLPGATRRPLSPAHGSAALAADGSLTIGWVRRARGAWLWRDGVGVPLTEQVESYLVGLGPVHAPLLQWLCSEPKLTLTASELTTARLVGPGAPLFVRQRGDHDLSPPLPLGGLP